MNFMSFPAGCMYFMVYEYFKFHMEKKISYHFHPSFCHFLGGCLGELSSILLRNPFEVVKQQMQMGLDTSVTQTFKNIYSRRGFRGFYVGFWTFVFREAPFSAILMATYEVMKVWTLRGIREEKDMTFLENALNGAVAGSVASLLTNPIDVLKTRMMINRDVSPMGLYRLTLDMLSDEGLTSFFKACHIRMLTISAATVLFFTMYEPTKAAISAEYKNTIGREKTI